MTTTLKGMTWDHPRGYDPMVATSAAWLDQTGVEIVWDKRSLQDFETFPVKQLAEAYDLIVIDHPHVGQITAEDSLAPLDIPGREAELTDLARSSVGQSYRSYTYAGRQWAFPIDAAAQVMVFRADILPQPPETWDEVIHLARHGKIILPMRPPHSLMSFCTLAANLGAPCRSDGEGEFVDADAGRLVVEMLRDISALIDPEDFERDPIAASEILAASVDRPVMPLGYGYVSYARPGFRKNPLAFTDIPVAAHNGPVGSALGGTGIAVSAFSDHADAAIDYAYWVASGDVQRTLYAASGGQPGHAAAWEDEAVNAAAGNFYRKTRGTLEGAWVRPRHNGYMAFQDEASQRLNAGLRSTESASAILAALNALFRESF